MTEREALKLALEALEDLGMKHFESTGEVLYKETFTVIKEALMSGTDGAQPEPWEKFCDSNCVWTDHHPDCKLAKQEPVAWRAWVSKFPQGTGSDWVYVTKPIMKDRIHNQPLYTTPPQRKPLTAMEVYDVVHDADLDWHTGFALGEDENRFVVFARAIEAAHGIKDET